MAGNRRKCYCVSHRSELPDEIGWPMAVRLPPTAVHVVAGKQLRGVLESWRGRRFRRKKSMALISKSCWVSPMVKIAHNKPEIRPMPISCRHCEAPEEHAMPASHQSACCFAGYLHRSGFHCVNGMASEGHCLSDEYMMIKLGKMCRRPRKQAHLTLTNSTKLHSDGEHRKRLLSWTDGTTASVWSRQFLVASRNVAGLMHWAWQWGKTGLTTKKPAIRPPTPARLRMKW